MDLKEVIEELSKADQSLVLPCGFRNPHSYRGYYERLAFELGENVPIANMLRDAKSAVNRIYCGWKGGENMMEESTPCYLAQEGCLGDPLELESLKIMIAAGKPAQEIEVPSPASESLIAVDEPLDSDTVAENSFDALTANNPGIISPIHGWTIRRGYVRGWEDGIAHAATNPGDQPSDHFNMSKYEMEAYNNLRITIQRSENVGLYDVLLGANVRIRRLEKEAEQARIKPKPQDELYLEAVRLVIENKRASVSMVQRLLAIGWTRAYAMVREMLESGLIPAEWGADQPSTEESASS